jgi:hypothetical protein
MSHGTVNEDAASSERERGARTVVAWSQRDRNGHRIGAGARPLAATSVPLCGERTYDCAAPTGFTNRQCWRHSRFPAMSLHNYAPNQLCFRSPAPYQIAASGQITGCGLHSLNETGGVQGEWRKRPSQRRFRQRPPRTDRGRSTQSLTQTEALRAFASSRVSAFPMRVFGENARTRALFGRPFLATAEDSLFKETLDQCQDTGCPPPSGVPGPIVHHSVLRDRVEGSCHTLPTSTMSSVGLSLSKDWWVEFVAPGGSHDPPDSFARQKEGDGSLFESRAETEHRICG